MKIDETIIQDMAHLARLRIQKQEREIYRKDLESLINWVGQLEGADTSSTTPALSSSLLSLRRREDIVIQETTPEQLLANAPDALYGMFAVPKVIE